MTSTGLHLWLKETRRAYVGETNIPTTFFQWFFDDMLVKEMKKENMRKSSGMVTLLRNWYLSSLVTVLLRRLLKVLKQKLLLVLFLPLTTSLTKSLPVAALADINVDDADYKIYINKGQMKVLKTALGNEKNLQQLCMEQLH